LPDGIFSKKISIWVNFWRTLETVGTFYGHLNYVITVCYILWLFGNLVAIWLNFHRFGILCHKKTGNPAVSVLWKWKTHLCILTELLHW
jgi:hypothetical protein